MQISMFDQLPPSYTKERQRYLSFNFAENIYFRLYDYTTVVFAVRISVRFFITLRELAGKGEETLEFTLGIVTVKEVLEELVKRHGKAFKDYLYDEEKRVRDHLQLLVNGKSVGLMEKLETRLKEGDRVAIVPPVGGG